jgi:glycosyltransferase involved in cell wall biosynthesis
VTIVNLHVNKVGRFWRIARRLPEIQFLAVLGGYGHQVVPRRIPRNVEIIDHVPASEMDAAVWSRTALLLAPSARESWGMTATEALQRGIPVLAHPTPGLLESLGAAGMFADRRDVREWVRIIRLLYRDGQLYRRRSEAAYFRGRALAEQSRAQLARFVDVIEGLVPHV